MCGICGIYNLYDKKKIEENLLEKMITSISHRGPDGNNHKINDRVGLGFARLSFLDLEGGMQPISNENSTITMICNGEIFNYKDLKRELENMGHTFRTKTDVEVILHLYEEFGLDFPSKLNGQFAIAIYDSRKEELILVRDQIGICPLFYTVLNDRVVFASEIKSILEYPGIERKLNLKALDQLMNYPGVISPNTFFRNIFSLQAGHLLLIRPEQEIRDIEYWDLIYDDKEEDLGEDYYIEKLRELMKESISRRLISDVPIGFYISGGLDSSVVACFIKKFMLNSYYSFSAEIEDKDLDESKFQKIVQCGIQSTHYRTEITEQKIWDNLSEVIYHTESAVKESYDVAAYLLSGLVSKSPAKAVLTGQGSDEFFYGYVGYMVDLFRNMQKDKMSKEECEINEMLWGDPYFRYERNHIEISKIHRQIYHKDLQGEWSSFSAWSRSPINTDRVKNLSSQKRRSYIDYKVRLSDHLLGEHGDRMFFSHSVEGRHPFLDRELIDFVIKIPDKYKLRGANEKYILKKAGEGIVPKEILKRKKFPFQAPGMSSMIKRPGKVDYLSDALIKKYGIFDVDEINRLKKIYSGDDFKLMGAYEIDYLLIALTTTILCESYHLTI